MIFTVTNSLKKMIHGKIYRNHENLLLFYAYLTLKKIFEHYQNFFWARAKLLFPKLYHQDQKLKK